MKQGQIYAGRLSGGSPAVVRVQNMTPELAQIVRLDSDLGRVGYIATARLADSFRLVSEGPKFTPEQVASWLEEEKAR